MIWIFFKKKKKKKKKKGGGGGGRGGRHTAGKATCKTTAVLAIAADFSFALHRSHQMLRATLGFAFAFDSAGVPFLIRFAAAAL